VTNLIEQLNYYGVKVVQQGDKNRVTLPWSVDQAPPGAVRLLRELRQAATEPWDEGKAVALFELALEHLRAQYPPGAIPWATKHRPELVEAIHRAARRYNEAFQNQNLAGCRQAVTEYEQAVMNLLVTFKENEA
jgi:hypothetical protein